MYRKVREIFATRELWKDFDVFKVGQKDGVFEASLGGMRELGGYLEEVRAKEGEVKEKKGVLEEFVQVRGGEFDGCG